MEDLFDLTKPQEQAFNALKKAIQDCKKSGLLFYNNYGTLGVCDRKKVKAYNDDPSPYEHEVNTFNPNEVILPCNEWADDSHYFHPA